jgi:hypothetical protein
MSAPIGKALQTVLLLVGSWATGLGVYAGAVRGGRGEVLPLETWRVIGAVTLVAWLTAAALLTLPLLRWLASRRPAASRPAMAAAGMALALLPVLLTTGFWYGWHPRHLLTGEAGFLGLLYGTSGVILALGLRRIAPPR